ncbi:MAG: Phage major capsid protein [Spirosoma sp.]|nr:Phage major capsid protein [Spirosoma sp.]
MNKRVNPADMIHRFNAPAVIDPGMILQKFDAAHSEVKDALTQGAEKLGAFGARLLDIEQKMSRRGGGGGESISTWGSQFTASEDFKKLNSNERGRARVHIRSIDTLTSAGSAGSLIAPDRQTQPIMMPRRRVRIRDLVSPGQTTSNAIEWPRQIGRQNSAATVAETALKPQSDMTFDLPQWPVRTIAHWTLASKQLMDDASAIMSLIDGDLRYGLALVEEAQLLNGGGTGSDLTGLYTGATTFAAPIDADAPTMIDVLLQAVAQVEDSDYEVDGIVLNPLDWRTIQLIKDAQGRYMGVGPFADQIAKLWQLPIAATKAMTRDKFMVGAFKQGAQIFDREDATVEVSSEDSDNFRKNLITIRAEERLAFVVKHPDAFVKGDFSDQIGS